MPAPLTHIECICVLELNAKLRMAMKWLENNPQTCTAAILISDKGEK